MMMQTYLLCTGLRNLYIYNACIYIYSIVVGYKSTYFVKDHSEAKNKYTEDDIVRMIEFLIDNIFVESGGVIFPISPSDSASH